MPDTKFATNKQRFGHVNATNRNSYLNIICYARGGIKRCFCLTSVCLSVCRVHRA